MEERADEEGGELVSREDRWLIGPVGAWAIWWSVLLALWIVIDGTFNLAELLAGVLAASQGTLLTGLVQRLAGSHVRLRLSWAVQSLRLPARILKETAAVFGVLGRQMLTGEEPTSGFLEISTRYGDDDGGGATRRALLVAGESMAPNTCALGIDARRNVMVVHKLITAPRRRSRVPERKRRRQ
jgi:multisubunit Na+/H+ antiporter MnhE subunit